MSVVKTFHDGISVESEVEESLRREQVLTVSAVDCLVTIGAAWSSICKKKSLFTCSHLWKTFTLPKI